MAAKQVHRRLHSWRGRGARTLSRRSRDTGSPSAIVTATMAHSSARLRVWHQGKGRVNDAHLKKKQAAATNSKAKLQGAGSRSADQDGRSKVMSLAGINASRSTQKKREGGCPPSRRGKMKNYWSAVSFSQSTSVPGSAPPVGSKRTTPDSSEQNVR